MDEAAGKCRAADDCRRGDGLLRAVPAVPLGGALAGKLTDIHSLPLENMTVTLRNAVTGAEVQTTTARGGRYHFSGLAQGEYTADRNRPAAVPAKWTESSSPPDMSSTFRPRLILCAAGLVATDPGQHMPRSRLQLLRSLRQLQSRNHVVFAFARLRLSSISESSALKPTFPAGLCVIVAKTFPTESPFQPASLASTRSWRSNSAQAHACLAQGSTCKSRRSGRSASKRIRSAIFAIAGFNATAGAPAVRAAIGRALFSMLPGNP